ncbi:MAG: hypothetical protein Q7W02_27355, partial [Candidatus Rokubacteria bacterium]|nr:hypothetical protein [Candidatus Rokubacteria bacterium]
CGSPDYLCGRLAYGCGSPDYLCGRLAYGCGSPDYLCGRLAYGCGSPDYLCGRLACACGSPFHRVQQHDLDPVTQRCVTSRQLTVDGDGHFGALLDADGGQKVRDRRALVNGIALRPVLAARHEPAEIGEECHGDSDGARAHLSNHISGIPPRLYRAWIGVRRVFRDPHRLRYPQRSP